MLHVPKTINTLIVLISTYNIIFFFILLSVACMHTVDIQISILLVQGVCLYKNKNMSTDWYSDTIYDLFELFHRVRVLGKKEDWYEVVLALGTV